MVIFRFKYSKPLLIKGRGNLEPRVVPADFVVIAVFDGSASALVGFYSAEHEYIGLVPSTLLSFNSFFTLFELIF